MTMGKENKSLRAFITWLLGMLFVTMGGITHQKSMWVIIGISTFTYMIWDYYKK